jgi:hypothetical protein
MGEAPFFLLLMPVFFCDPAIGFGTHTRLRKRLLSARSAKNGNTLA